LHKCNFRSQKRQLNTDVVDEWLLYLNKYTNNSYTLDGKNVLELGPGSDLGVGLFLLAKGCAQYNAYDVNNLMKSTPDIFIIICSVS